MTDMKKAVGFSRTGNPPDVVEYIDMETAPVGDDDALIDVEAAAINPSHLLTLPPSQLLSFSALPFQLSALSFAL